MRDGGTFSRICAVPAGKTLYELWPAGLRAHLIADWCSQLADERTSGAEGTARPPPVEASRLCMHHAGPAVRAHIIGSGGNRRSDAYPADPTALHTCGNIVAAAGRAASGLLQALMPREQGQRACHGGGGPSPETCRGRQTQQRQGSGASG